MSYEEVTDLDAEVTVTIGGTNKKTGKKNPTEAEGYYLGKRKVDSKKAKSGFCYIYILQTPTGNLGVWGKTDLDRKMEAVTPGIMTLIAYDKMVPTPNGEMYKFKVSVDKSNTIAVSGAANFDNTSESDDTEAASDSRLDSTTESDDDEDTAQSLALAAAERQARQARVQNLIKKNNKTT